MKTFMVHFPYACCNRSGEQSVNSRKAYVKPGARLKRDSFATHFPLHFTGCTRIDTSTAGLQGTNLAELSQIFITAAFSRLSYKFSIIFWQSDRTKKSFLRHAKRLLQEQWRDGFFGQRLDPLLQFLDNVRIPVSQIGLLRRILGQVEQLDTGREGHPPD